MSATARRARSTILRALVLLLGGTLLTVASAWIPTLLNPPMVSFPGLRLSETDPPVPVGSSLSVALASPPWLGTAGRPNVGVRETFGAIEIGDLAFMPDTPTWHYLIAAGWPAYAFHGGGDLMVPSVPPNDPRAPAVLELSRRFPTRQSHVASLPIAPCWPGFIVDVAFWGGALAAVVLAPQRVRAHWRRSRRCCPACGHRRLDASPVCPECGVADPAR